MADDGIGEGHTVAALYLVGVASQTGADNPLWRGLGPRFGEDDIVGDPVAARHEHAVGDVGHYLGIRVVLSIALQLVECIALLQSFIAEEGERSTESTTAGEGRVFQTAKAKLLQFCHHRGAQTYCVLGCNGKEIVAGSIRQICYESRSGGIGVGCRLAAF